MANQDEILITNALGRMGNLGNLYDARKDTFCGTIFNKSVPESAITKMNTPSMDLDYVFKDNYASKFDKLNIVGELKLSILCGAIQLGGHGTYFNDRKKSARAVRVTMLYKTVTVQEELNLFAEELRDCYSLDALQGYSAATHIVTRITWGANATITMESANSEDKSEQEISGMLKAEIDKLDVKVSGEGSKKNDEQKGTDQFILKVFADILPDDGKLPQTVEATIGFLQNLPTLMKNANDGKGKPIVFIMMPISCLQQYLKLANITDNVIHQIDESLILKTTTMFDEFSQEIQKLTDAINDLQLNFKYLPKDSIKNLQECLNEKQVQEASLREKFKRCLIDIRSGYVDANKLQLVIEGYSNSATTESNTKTQNHILKLYDKVKRMKKLEKLGAFHIGDQSGLDDFKGHQNNIELWMLFLSSNPTAKENREANLKLFVASMEEKRDNVGYGIIDCDIFTEANTMEQVGDGNRICIYQNRAYVQKDYLLKFNEKAGQCLTRSQSFIYVREKTNDRTTLELQCPGSMYASCEKDPREWFCDKCEQIIEYGFDGHVYCLCGKAPYLTLAFRCNSKQHGNKFIQFQQKDFEELIKSVKRDKELNILILGETGVGKSTWINAIYNYLSFSSLEEAQEKALRALVPSSFEITADNYEETKTIKIGDDKNEVLTTGQSATQEPKAYVFHTKKLIVRLIDTPGIGDCRGPEQDNRNMEDILLLLDQYKEIHGICILLKPNDSRINLTFRFCIKELLKQLHRKASNNLVFCFTNSRGTFYRPGNTLPILKKLLEEIAGVKITLSKHTMYCFDNESFRFLCATKQSISFSEKEKNDFSESWQTTASETRRLFEHVKTLVPHCTAETLTLNSVRSKLKKLAQPIADVCMNIDSNQKVCKDKLNEVSMIKKGEKDLASRLMQKFIDLELEKIDYPRTVCCGAKCIVLRSIPGTTQTITKYKQICHDPCFLSQVVPDTYPNPDLLSCAAMDSETCRECGCRWEVHMHIRYIQKEVVKDIVDETVQNLLKDKQTEREAIETFIRKIKSKIVQNEKEKKTMMEISGKFGSFLKCNAIAPYNDALGQYLEWLISEEKNKVNVGGDNSKLDNLRNLLRLYKTEVDSLKEGMRRGNQNACLTITQINDEIKRLYSLPLNGKRIKKIMKMAEGAAKAHVASTEIHVYTQTGNYEEKADVSTNEMHVCSQKNKPTKASLWSFFTSN